MTTSYKNIVRQAIEDFKAGKPAVAPEGYRVEQRPDGRVTYVPDTIPTFVDPGPGERGRDETDALAQAFDDRVNPFEPDIAPQGFRIEQRPDGKVGLVPDSATTPQPGKPMVGPVSEATGRALAEGLDRMLASAVLRYAREERAEAKRVGTGPAMDGVDVTDHSEDPVLMERIGELVRRPKGGE